VYAFVNGYGFDSQLIVIQAMKKLKLFKYYTELHEHILDLFNENNVQIMAPAYEGDPQTPKVISKEQWNMPLASDGKD